MLKAAQKRLVGRTITSIRQMTREEADHLGFFSRPPILEFDDGSLFFPMNDDEDNDGGALWYMVKDNNFTNPVDRN